MTSPPPTRRVRWIHAVLGVALGVAAASGLALLGPGGSGSASAREVLRAGSVCEAQELRARQAEDPGLEIEIPPEYDKEFPSLSACRSHELAWSDELPGPNQPIPFSHAHHAGEYEIACLYCHGGTDRSRAAGVPSVELCMGCHEQFPAEYDELEGIRLLKQYWEIRETIPWIQVFWVPEHVQFRHNAHVAAGLECQTCHGAIQNMHKVYVDKDLKWWKLTNPPAKTLEMGWCIDCHRSREVSQDCFTCHY